MAVWLALRGQGYGVVGLGNAFARVPNWAGYPIGVGLPGYIYFDQDIASNKQAVQWLRTARDSGIPARPLGALLGDLDACEYAQMCGLEVLGSRLEQLIRAA